MKYNYDHQYEHEGDFRADLLLRGAKVLRDDAANPQGCQFDLSSWASPAEEREEHKVPGNHRNTYYHAPEVFRQTSLGTDIDHVKLNAMEPPNVDCGTKACAFGLMALSGEFAKEGLTHEYAVTSWDHKLVMLLPKHGGSTGFSAAESFFGITDEDASYLFDPSNYNGTPTEAEGEIEVAERIEAFARGYIDEYYHPAYTSEDDRQEEDED